MECWGLLGGNYFFPQVIAIDYSINNDIDLLTSFYARRFRLGPDLIKIWNVPFLIDSDDKMMLLHQNRNGLLSYIKHFNGICPISHPNLFSFAQFLQSTMNQYFLKFLPSSMPTTGRQQLKRDKARM